MMREVFLLCFNCGIRAHFYWACFNVCTTAPVFYSYVCV